MIHINKVEQSEGTNEDEINGEVRVKVKEEEENRRENEAARELIYSGAFSFWIFLPPPAQPSSHFLCHSLSEYGNRLGIPD